MGEPSKPVKRAVKRAAKSTSTDDPATKKVAQKKKDAAAKKPKAKAAAPKKQAREKKDLTEEQKAAKDAKLARAKLNDLKKAALTPPSAVNKSAYHVFFSEKQKGHSLASEEGSDVKTKLKNRTAAITAEWRSLTAAELEVRSLFSRLSHRSYFVLTYL